MSIKDKLHMTPREAAYVVALEVLRQASVAPNEYLEDVYRQSESRLSDGEIKTLSKHYNKIHNDLLDKAHDLYRLDGMPL